MSENIIKEISDDTIKLVDKTDDITELLIIWKEIDKASKTFNDTLDKIKIKIKNFLKEREWTHYNDEKTKISISISEIEKEMIDKNQLKIMLTDTQYAQIRNIKSYERLNIITPERRTELSKMIRG